MSLSYEPQILEDIDGKWEREQDKFETYGWKSNEYIARKINRTGITNFETEQKEIPENKEKLVDMLKQKCRKREKDIADYLRGKDDFVAESITWIETYGGGIDEEKLTIEKFKQILNKNTYEDEKAIYKSKKFLSFMLFLVDVKPPEISWDIEKKFRRFRIRCCKCGDKTQAKIRQNYDGGKECWKVRYPNSFYCDSCLKDLKIKIKEKKDLNCNLDNVNLRQTNYELIPDNKICYEKYKEIIGEIIGSKKPGVSQREIELRDLIERTFPDNETVVPHAPIENLELDIFLPDRDIAFEYQGRQHGEPVDFFGGEEKFNKQKENDKRTKRLCKENDIQLIEFWHDEKINKEKLMDKLPEKTKMEIL